MSFIDHLAPATRERLLRMGRPLDLDADDVLLRQGDESDQIYLVEEGWLDVLDTRSTPPTLVDRLTVGDVVGELAFVRPQPRSADVRARTSARLRVWQHDALVAAMSDDAAFSAAIYRALARTGAERMLGKGQADLVQAPRDPGATTTQDPIVAEIIAAFDRAWELQEADAHAAVLTAISRRLAPLAGTAGADALGASVTRRLRERLCLARTAELLMERTPGRPLPSALWEHVCMGAPQGGSPAGEALDQALLAQPTLQGARARTRGLVRLLGREDPGPGDHVALLAPGNVVLERGVRELLATRGATLLPLTPLPGAPADPRAVLALAQGSQPRHLPPLRAVVIEGVPDILPDRLVAGLVATVSERIQPGGALIIGFSQPAPDQPFLDHVLGLPLLPRATATATRLVQHARFDSIHPHESPRSDAPGLLVVAHRAADT